MRDPERTPGVAIGLLLASSVSAVAFADPPPAPSSPWFWRVGALAVFYDSSPAASFRPYAGLGAAYVIIFKEYDGAVEHLDVHDNWATVAQAGAEYRLSPECDFFVDVKHLWLALDADGFLAGGVPVAARVTLDPFLVSVGVKFRFE